MAEELLSQLTATIRLHNFPDNYYFVKFINDSSDILHSRIPIHPINKMKTAAP